MTTKCTTNQMYPRKLATTDLSDGYTTAIIAVAPGEIEVELSHDGQLLSWHASETEARAAKNDHRYDAIASSAVVIDPTPDYDDDAGWQRIAETIYGSDRATPQTVDMLRLAWRAAPASARPAIAALGMRAVAALKEPDGVPGEEGGPGGDGPDDEAVLTALAEFIRQAGDVIPDETATGKAFWRARSAAAARAAIQIAKGVRVTLLPNGDALVPSASGSAIYRYDDRARRCSCRAGAKDHGCWHVEAISATRAAQQVTA